MIIMFLLIVYSFFLPQKLGTGWFFTGFATYMAGLLIFVTAIVNAVTTPSGQVFKKGAYRYSRHPMYISSLMINVGVGVASASWIFLLLSVFLMLLQYPDVGKEEQACLEMYGEEYRQYMHRTRRWLGLPKSG